MVGNALLTSARQAFSTADRSTLRSLLHEHRQQPYRADQAYRHFWSARVESFSAMHTLPVETRAFLEARFLFSTVRPVVRREADQGRTIKYLLALADGRRIETVLMHQEPSNGGRPRITICVSSQVGCPIRCSFCATGQSGFDRNLTEAEIVDQVLLGAREMHASGRSLTNVVFMGMGEPMNNYAAVVAAIRRLALKDTTEFSPRRVTVSTIGLVPFIERLSQDAPNVNLAISLHAPDDELRSQLVPVNRKYPITAVVAAARAHAEKTGRRVSYEYVLLAGVNDRLDQADRLADVVGSRLAHVNLIPMNSVEGSSLQAPSSRQVLAFQARLLRARVPTTIRVTRGLDIDAACGQLRAREPQQLALRSQP